MKRYVSSMTALFVLGLSLSGASHALLIWKPDGTRSEAQVVGNRLMLVDANNRLTPARDGTYKTDAGKAIVVQGGVIATPGALGAPIDSKAQGVATAPPVGKGKDGVAAIPKVPAGSSGLAPAGRPDVRPAAAAGAAAKAVRLDQLASKAQFKALPDDTLLDVGGRQIRKADLVADFNRRAAAGTAGATTRPAGLAALQARLAAEDKAAIAASGVEVRKAIAEMRAKGGG